MRQWPCLSRPSSCCPSSLRNRRQRVRRAASAALRCAPQRQCTLVPPRPCTSQAPGDHLAASVAFVVFLHPGSQRSLICAIVAASSATVAPLVVDPHTRAPLDGAIGHLGVPGDQGWSPSGTVMPGRMRSRSRAPLGHTLVAPLSTARAWGLVSWFPQASIDFLVAIVIAVSPAPASDCSAKCAGGALAELACAREPTCRRMKRCATARNSPLF